MTIRIVLLIAFGSGLGFGGTWSGALVDAKCYAAEERNVNPTNTLMAVNVDRDAEIRYCHPTPKTTFFAIVDRDGISFTLDQSGNTKAGELVRALGRKTRVEVTVTGQQSKDSIAVESISLAR